MTELSGGNQQKSIFARWITGPLRVLLLDEPTHGVDIRSKGQIYDIIRELAVEGAAVLLVSRSLRRSRRSANLLPVFGAAFLGSVTLTRRKFHILGTVLGVYLIETGTNGTSDPRYTGLHAAALRRRRADPRHDRRPLPDGRVAPR